MTSLFEKMFGKSVKEIRETNIKKRETIAKVKKLKKAKEAGMHPTQIDKEARELAEELGVSYDEAVEYLKEEKKSAATKKKLKEIGGFLGEIGQRARADTKRRYGSGGINPEIREPKPLSTPSNVRRPQFPVFPAGRKIKFK